MDPSTSKAGVLAGNVLALRLNVDFSTAGKTRNTPNALDALKLTKGKLNGKSVFEVLAWANQALGGGTLPPGVYPLPLGVSLSDLNEIVAKINDNFDRGREDDGYLVAP